MHSTAGHRGHGRRPHLLSGEHPAWCAQQVWLGGICAKAVAAGDASEQGQQVTDPSHTEWQALQAPKCVSWKYITALLARYKGARKGSDV